MPDISLEAVTGKLNSVGYDAFMKALRHAKSAGHRHVELAHWLFHILQQENTDVGRAADRFKLDRSKLMSELAQVIEGFRKNQTEMPEMSEPVIDALDRGWYYATLFFGETQIRTGHILTAALKGRELKRALLNASKEFDKINIDALLMEHRGVFSTSIEEKLRPMDGSGMVGAGTPGAADAAAGGKGQTPLGRYSQDLTAKAKAGEMDPILGRDEEIRQIVDVLMRRRQNNPILTGEAGVGKTAVVEGFAQHVAAGDVPPPLKGVRVCALDIGLMQAGASMKGEFEQRLRSVIDEVQASPTPIILFVDEAHTLIGAGGSAGTGDAANLLKPALARGTLRTIAATTWAEYKKYIEKDPALTRRFQVVQVAEPSEDKAILMVRGVASVLEKHHRVQVLDEALESAVRLSHRYIPARQLPDKAVSLLDTACARVAISQHATPPQLEDCLRSIEGLQTELEIISREEAIGIDAQTRRATAEEQLTANLTQQQELDARWQVERGVVEKILALRAKLRQRAQAVERTGSTLERAAAPAAAATAGQTPEPLTSEQRQAHLAELRQEQARLHELQGDAPLILPSVDEQAVASVVEDWPGVPVGRMVKNEIEAVLNLADTLNGRVIGQQHALELIARRIQTSRAKLDNRSEEHTSNSSHEWISYAV